MAIVVTSLGSTANTANAASYDTAPTRAPAANTLVLVGVCGSDTAGTIVDPTSVVGAGLTFTKISGITFDTTVNWLHHVSAWRAMGGAPDTSRFTVTWANNATGTAFEILEVSGVSTAGVNGANAVPQSATSRNGGLDSALTIFAPGSAGSTANAWLAFCGTESSAATETPQGNWTKIEGFGYATPATGLISGWTTLSGATLATFVGSSIRKGGVILELALDNPAAPGGAVRSPYYASYYYPRMVA
jgi:hypothetical protein